MNNYTIHINALRKCAKEHKDDVIPLAHIKVSHKVLSFNEVVQWSLSSVIEVDKVESEDKE